MRDILAHPSAYHWLRQVMTLGMPFDAWIPKYGLDDPQQRVADLGCGPADILRYLRPGRQPGFYLGIDVSERYLSAARKRAARAGLDAEFLRLDLHLLPSDDAVRHQLLELLQSRGITTVLLLGVLHHIDDAAVQTTLALIHSLPAVQRMMTTDVVYLPGERINNFLCSRDRGEFVRDVAGYDTLASGSPWARFEKSWSSPGLSSVKYLHYAYSK